MVSLSPELILCHFGYDLVRRGPGGLAILLQVSVCDVQLRTPEVPLWRCERVMSAQKDNADILKGGEYRYDV